MCVCRSLKPFEEGNAKLLGREAAKEQDHVREMFLILRWGGVKFFLS